MSDQQLITILPQDVVDELRSLAKDLKSILPKLNEEPKPNSLGDWLTEEEAQNLLGRKTTWFYNMRKSGELEGKKRGNKWWYRLTDIQDFIDK